MADLAPVVETLETRWMRAWVNRDARTLKALTTRDFILLTGSKPPVLLDANSWIEAATTRWLCSSFRFGDLDVRQIGGIALFAAQIDLKAKMDGHDWSGKIWVVDLWRKGRIRRGWRLAHRTVSRVNDNPDVPAAIRTLQLWRNERVKAGDSTAGG